MPIIDKNVALFLSKIHLYRIHKDYQQIIRKALP